MNPEMVPLVVGLLVFLASLISLRVGISVAVIEVLLGAIASSLGMQTEDWMIYIANFGGIILTFMAGTEIDTDLMKEKFKESFLIGGFSFLVPFTSAFLFCFYGLHWTLNASLIAGATLSTTSLAVVYSVLVETNLNKTEIGKLLMASTFVTNMGTAIALSLLFVKPSLEAAMFYVVSILVIIGATKFSHIIFENPKLKNKVIEPEIKYIFVLLLIFMFFAKLGEGHAILPAFLLGLFMSKHFIDKKEPVEDKYQTQPLLEPFFGSNTNVVRTRLRTVAYAFITPIFFIVGGLKISLPLIMASFGLFAILFIIKIASKFIGVYFLARKYIPNSSMYTTLIMSTGLTFGAIASIFGLNSGYINQVQYSILIGVVIASAIIPTFIAQKWFMPVEEEDIIDD